MSKEFTALKNVSDKVVRFMADGSEYAFAPSQIRLIKSDISEMLLSKSIHSATGAKSLDVVEDKDIPEDVMAEMPASSDIKFLINNLDTEYRTMYDGHEYTFPPKCKTPVEAAIAKPLSDHSFIFAMGMYVLTVFEPKPKRPASGFFKKNEDSKKETK
jgi:hypothetical protein